MLRAALLAFALFVPAIAANAQPDRLVSTTTRSAGVLPARAALDLPALDARALRIAHELFSDVSRAAAEAAPHRQALLGRDLGAFAQAILGVRGEAQAVHLVGSQVRPDGAVETFVRVRFTSGAEDLRVLWKDGALSTVQRGAPAASYALSADR